MQETPYQRSGGEEGVRRLVDRFYDLMEGKEIIRKLHPEDLSQSREKLFLFLSGWLGGPQLYVEKHGHPMLRRRHLPFPIGVEERDAWMACMKQAMLDVGLDKLLFEQLLMSFSQTADFMRNKDV
jgi:hemoglobin